ncbi:MAG: hypothetical protein JJD92_10235 [Frankiaceae bacterium]|nr:hypothetical protein [Frankiaceae bacterium]
MSAISPESADVRGAAQNQTLHRFRQVSLALGAVSLTKYLGLAFKDFANAPHFFLIFLVLPFLLAAWLVSRARKTSAIVFLLFGGLFAWLMVQQLVGGIEDFWGDYLLVFFGLPVSLVGIGLAVKVLANRE